MMDSQDDNELKVILLGEAGVGKTNLINISTGGQFNENEQSSSNSTFSMKKLTVKGKSYAIKLWDTIGQEKLRHLTKLFYNDSKIVIFVYDITVKETFEQIKNYWIKDVEEKLGNVVKGIVGNKIDLFINEQVTEEEGEEVAKSVGAKFLATSAKTEGPKKFEDLLTQLLEEYLTKNGDIKTDKKKVVLDKKKNVGTGGKKCC